MNRLDVEAIRAQVRALDYVRGTPAEIALWREGDAEARANLAIEGMDLDADEHALFDMLRAEAVPPPHATAIVLTQIGRASCRGRGCKYVKIQGVAGILKKNK